MLKARVLSLEARVRVLEVEEEREARSAAGSRDLRASPGRASVASSGRNSPIAAEDRPGREELCRDIAAFVNRALRGEHRGSSGRDRLRVANRYYLVFSNFEGEAFPVPLFFCKYR